MWRRVFEPAKAGQSAEAFVLVGFQGLSTRVAIGLDRLQLTSEEWTAAREKAMATAPDISWGQWQRLGGQLGIRGGHAGAGLTGGWEKHGQEHPDWFALQPDGTRDQSKAGDRFRLCMSNQGLIDYVSLTDRMVYYWNGVAERVTKAYPNLLFVVDAYSCYSQPPARRKLHPNLVVRYVPSTAVARAELPAAARHRPPPPSRSQRRLACVGQRRLRCQVAHRGPWLPARKNAAPAGENRELHAYGARRQHRGNAGGIWIGRRCQLVAVPK